MLYLLAAGLSWCGAFSILVGMIELNQVELNHDDRCPCSSGEVYGACCGRFLGEFAASGTLSAPAPEQLMRSRFTAFATGDAAYLLASWHPSTRPATLDLEDDIRWYRLDILASSGGPFDVSGTVEFVAYYRSVPGTPAEERVKGSMHELSRFEKVDGAWFYVDGDVR